MLKLGSSASASGAAGGCVNSRDWALAQVSRRLTRRIKKALYERHYGEVKLAVYAFVYLLAKATDEESSYTFNYFSKELIHQPDTLVCDAYGTEARKRNW